MAFVNKMDRVGADFFATVESIKKKLKTNPVILQLPMGAEDSFTGVIDLINMQEIVWDDETKGTNFSSNPVRDEYKTNADDYREKLVEAISEVNDDIMEKYLMGQDISKEDLNAAVRKATIAKQIVPVFCGSALKNKGIQPLLDGIELYMPSPLDIPAIRGAHPDTGEEIEFQPKKKAPLAALIFKVSIVDGRKLSFIRIYSGTIETGAEVYNPLLKKSEKLSRILQMHAMKRERLKEASAGEIVGIVGLRDSGTGDTLCSREHPVCLEKMEYEKPVISIAIEPKTHADQEKIEGVLEKFTMEDPTLTVSQDSETGQTLLSGMGELHLEIIVSRMQKEFNTHINVGNPQVVYRETINNKIKGSAVFEKEISGKTHFAQLEISLKPLERGLGVSFKSLAGNDKLPEQYLASVEKGIRESLEGGYLKGYPLVDAAITIEDGAFDERSSELAFTVCASMACKNVLENASLSLLEPIMDVEIFIPEAFMGDAIADINTRGGKIESIDSRSGSHILRAVVPLSKMFGYSTALRSASQGRGTFSMKFLKFDKV